MPRLETEDCVGIFNWPNLRRHWTVCIKKASFEIFLWSYMCFVMFVGGNCSPVGWHYFFLFWWILWKVDFSNPVKNDHRQMLIYNSAAQILIRNFCLLFYPTLYFGQMDTGCWLAGLRLEQQGEAGVLAEWCGDSCVSSPFMLGSFNVGCLLKDDAFVESCPKRRWGA